MAKEKEQKFRVSGYVNEEVYQKILDFQFAEQKRNGKKPTMGEVLELLIKKAEA